MRVAIYIRVSTTRQAEEGFSLAAQQKVLEDYCKQHKYIIHKIYADKGISGKDVQHRDAFRAMLQDAKERKFQAVLVWKLTRFTRSVIVVAFRFHIRRINVKYSARAVICFYKVFKISVFDYN